MKNLLIIFIMFVVSFMSFGCGQKTTPTADMDMDTFAIDTSFVSDTAYCDTSVMDIDVGDY